MLKARELLRKQNLATEAVNRICLLHRRGGGKKKMNEMPAHLRVSVGAGFP